MKWRLAPAAVTAVLLVSMDSLADSKQPVVVVVDCAAPVADAGAGARSLRHAVWLAAFRDQGYVEALTALGAIEPVACSARSLWRDNLNSERADRHHPSRLKMAIGRSHIDEWLESRHVVFRDGLP